MRTLFLKTLLAFALANFLIAVATFFIAIPLQADPGTLVVSPVLAAHGKSLESLIRAGQADDARRSNETLFETTRIDAYLFDTDLRELLGRSAPPDIQHLAAEALRNTVLSTRGFPGGSTMAQGFATRDGRRFVIAAAIPFPPIGRVLSRPDVWVPRIATVVGMAALLCWLFTSYLVAPIRRLQTAVRSLAAGDWTARADGRILRRGDEIAQLARDFDQMAAQIESLIADQRTFFRHASHELRSPLARMQVAIGLLRRKQDDPLFDRMEREAERLNRMIDQLLALAKLEHASVQPRRELIDLSSVVAQIAADAEFEGRTRNVALQVAMPPATISGDEPMLRSLFENVLRNAIHFAAAGSTIDIDAARRDEFIDIRIRDRGPGVPAEHLETIFEPFKSLRDGRIGGLGLTIARRSAELHGGTIRAENHADGGLVVSVRLPVK
ncbi:MAG: ATP-binding protein [Phycisphaerae bacterium]